jgi:small subunit ribosomal protein S1
MSEKFSELLEESLINADLAPGTIIKGTVVDIGKEYVIVNAGLKSEGAISREEFINAKGELEINVGDEVDVALEMIEDGYGETRLSREKAKRAESWRELETYYESRERIVGRIIGRVKGGFTVDVVGLKAFLPGSLVDIRPIRDPENLEGKELEFKVIKMDAKRNNIVVSRRAVLEEAISEERSGVLENLNEGAEVEGIIKNLTDYGAFVDLGGVDGLLHITDMSWKRIKHPSEMVQIGQKLKVAVLKIDRDNARVSLGIKQLGGDPWKGIEDRYPAGTRFKGKVTNITDYGCFIELEEGIEGLVHMSEMDWTNKNVQPSKLVSLGQEVEVLVLEVDGSRRRISLGMKQCADNPWAAFAAIHKKGEKMKGPIRSITDFGVFIGLDGGIDGLIHISDVAWDPQESEKAVREFNKGDELEAVILAIEPERERVSLGIKQLHQDPFTDYLQEHEKGSLVKGKVTEVDAQSVKIELGDQIFGVLKAADISRKRVSDASKEFRAGQEVEAQVMGVDHKTREVQLSIKAMDQADAQALKNLNRDADAAAKTTLGDLMKSKDEE